MSAKPTPTCKRARRHAEGVRRHCEEGATAEQTQQHELENQGKASSSAAVPIVLSPTTDCQADGAVCTKAGKALSSSLSATVTGAASKPVAFELVANCPNSFNAETQIAYILPGPG